MANNYPDPLAAGGDPSRMDQNEHNQQYQQQQAEYQRQLAEYQKQQAAAGASGSTVAPAKSKMGLAITLLVVGLLLGGAAGYFIGDFLVFRPAQEKAAAERQALEDRIAALESDQTGTSLPGEPTKNDGTGTVDILQGITPDPLTDDWSVYTNEEHHFSFRYPANYEVRETPQPLDNEDQLFEVALFQAGSNVEAGSVRVYATPANDGPSTRDVTLFKWPSLLPTGLQGKSAGAGVAPGVESTTVTLNGNAALELTGVEGKALTATPDGQTYTAYFIEDRFDASYLVGTCGTDQTKQENLVACPFLTTFKLIE